MKAIINLQNPRKFQSRKYFGNMNPYLLPILGKKLVEFYLDYCVLCAISDVLVLQSEYDEDVAAFLGDGGKWGLNLRTSTVSDESVEEIIAKNVGFVGGNEILVMSGFFFPLYDKAFGTSQEPSSVNADGENPHEKSASQELEIPKISAADFAESASVAIVHGGLKKLSVPCRPLEIDSIKSYFNLNMNLLRGHCDSLFMRGYSAEASAFLGMNDVIKTYAEVLPPVVIGDNVQIESGSIIGENTVIGDTSIVDMRSVLKNTIVFDYTYVGTDLDLDSKIVAGSRIIDPLNDIVLEMRDEHFSSAMRKNSMVSLLKRAIEIPTALALMLPLAILRLPFFLFGAPKKSAVRILKPSGRSVKIYEYVSSNRLCDIWFFKLSIDRLPKLKHVVFGNMSLIGDTVRDANKDAELLNRYKYYSAGAFTYADSLGHFDAGETLIDDIYYRYNRSIRTDLQLLLCSFPIRLFHTSQDEV